MIAVTVVKALTEMARLGVCATCVAEPATDPPAAETTAHAATAETTTHAATAETTTHVATAETTTHVATTSAAPVATATSTTSSARHTIGDREPHEKSGSRSCSNHLVA
jgi:hypothetical protein